MVRRIRGRFADAGALESAKFIWCLHCECAYPGEWFRSKGWSACPGDRCDGSILDWQTWEDSQARRAHPEYPGVPVSGGFYPMF